MKLRLLRGVSVLFAGLASLYLVAEASALNVQIQWDYGDNAQESFRVYRCAWGGGSPCAAPTSSLGINIGPADRQVTDPTAAGGTAYCYYIRAVSAAQVVSDPSNACCLTTPVPGVPTHLRFSVPPPDTGGTNLALPTITVQVRDGLESVVTSATTSITMALATTTNLAIPLGQMSLVSVDSEETVVGTYGGRFAVDGDPLTFWITQYGDDTNPAPLPHTIVLDLGAVWNLTGVTYLPRQDHADAAGTVTQYQVGVSVNGTVWGTPPATGSWANDTTLKTANFMGRSGRYIRLIATAEAHGGQWMSAAELTALETPTGGGSLQGTLVKSAVSGVVSFTDLSINQAGGYVLQASASGLTAVIAPTTMVDLPITSTMPYILRVGH